MKTNCFLLTSPRCGWQIQATNSISAQLDIFNRPPLTATDNLLILHLLPTSVLMFNIWKQAWRNEDSSRTEHEASVNLETLSGATSDQLHAGSACVPRSVSTML